MCRHNSLKSSPIQDNKAKVPYLNVKLTASGQFNGVAIKEKGNALWNKGSG